MKVAAYIHVRRMRNPTGVGQHIIHMVDGLHHREDLELKVLAPRGDLDASGRLPVPLADVSTVPLPMSRRVLEAAWWAVNIPKVDRWAGGADWVYCPAEAYVATKRARLAITVHDTHAFETDLPWSNTADHQRFHQRWRRLFGPIRRRARLILAVSEFTRSRLVKLLGFDAEKIEVVGNGVEDAYFDEVPAVDVPAEPYLYVIGGLTRRKGGGYLIDLATRLRAARPELKILVSGAGEMELEMRADGMGNIRRLGYVPTERQVALLRGSRLLIFLSRYEGFGIPALEAMAAGTPVIVSHFAALPEIVGDAGIIVDPEKTEAVLEKVLTLEKDAGLRQELIARGRRRAGEFRWSQCVRRLIDALERHR